ncbi:MAG: methyltransferase domain-containing protein [Chlamydiales bacterium]|nr:methyltransferase domain-containing protein [Chlamydiales bacterium]
MNTSWQPAADWYDTITSDKGHEYHRTVIMPELKKMLSKTSSLLDLACGQGVLSSYLPKNCRYLGIDIAKKLVQSAKKRHPDREFKTADCTGPLDLNETFDAAACVLALQNIADPLALLKNAHKHLNSGAQLILVLNHPCFRIPRQSSWGFDPKQKMQYRRTDRYMSPLDIPIRVKDAELIAFHRPLSEYFHCLKSAGFVICNVHEWCSPKTSTGKNARAENRARAEFPLFLTIEAKKW